MGLLEIFLILYFQWAIDNWQFQMYKHMNYIFTILFCSICHRYEFMADKISQMIESTAQLMEVISYMRECEEKTIYQLKDEVTHASITLFFLLDYATLPRLFLLLLLLL